MAEHSPTPWRIADGMSETIVDSTNRVQASAANAETAAYIVEAVNGVDATLKLQRTLLGWSIERVNLLNSLSEEQERGYLLEEERDRLRDLVRRMIPGVEEDLAIAKAAGESVKGLCALRGVDSSEVDEVIEQWSSLLREAREALGEQEP